MARVPRPHSPNVLFHLGRTIRVLARKMSRHRRTKPGFCKILGMYHNFCAPLCQHFGSVICPYSPLSNAAKCMVLYPFPNNSCNRDKTRTFRCDLTIWNPWELCVVVRWGTQRDRGDHWGTHLVFHWQFHCWKSCE